MLARDNACRPLGFHSPCQHLHHIAEGQVRIAYAGIRTATAAGYKQIGMGRLGSADKLTHEASFAPTRTTRNENHLSVPGQSFVQEPVQLRQLTLAFDKGALFAFGGFRFVVQKCMGGELAVSSQ